ncbi:MAG: hypothetical protein M3537_10065 [Chloroflexota bacterium]|nr:hypothetical protein [Chloroflexota bacterium]
MTRAIRFGIIAGLILVLLAGGAAALAFNGEGPNAERVVELLDDQEITTDTAELDALADVYGLGGAVRILAFADAAGVEPSEIAEMREDGMGWGQIARALAEEDEEFDLKPGIGWIMGGHGQEQGQGQGQGQEKEKVHGQGGGDTGD